MEKNKEKEKHEMRLSFMKTNPKPNAKTYEFRTVGEIFDAMEDVKMFNKFLKDFKQGMTSAIAMRKAIVSMTPGSPKDVIKLEKFDWIND